MVRLPKSASASSKNRTWRVDCAPTVFEYGIGVLVMIGGCCEGVKYIIGGVLTTCRVAWYVHSVHEWTRLEHRNGDSYWVT